MKSAFNILLKKHLSLNSQSIRQITEPATNSQDISQPLFRLKKRGKREEIILFIEFFIMLYLYLESR